MKSSFFNYLFATGIITIIILLVYATVQQSYRTAANDPQIQLSEDIAERLSAGKPVDTYFSDTIDISKSLSTFITLFDGSGNPVRSTGYLDGQMCKLPSGLFDHTRKNQMHSVTWQPRSGVRMAIVL